MKQVDVIIGGGGMVGLPLALALGKGGLKVAVADALPPATAVALAFDGRVSALAYAAIRMLRALEVWPQLEPQAQPIHQILVSDGAIGRTASPFSLHFDAEEVGADSLGHIAENRHIRAALYAAVEDEKNITLIAPASVVSLTSGPAKVTARLSDGSELEAALAVAADGRESQLRAQMGIGVIGWSYPQTGIVATVHHARPHNGVAYEHFLPSGPFAILPMTGDRSSLVWTEAKDKAPAMLSLDGEDFDAEVAARFGAHLGETKVVGSALVVSPELPSGARLCPAPFRAGGRLRPWHSSHRRPGTEFGLERCRRLGGNRAGCGAPGPRYRRARRPEAL